MKAIEVALLRYFSFDGGDSLVSTYESSLIDHLAPYRIKREIDFELTLPVTEDFPNTRTVYFTLLPDKTLRFPND